MRGGLATVLPGGTNDLPGGEVCLGVQQSYDVASLLITLNKL